MEEIPLTTNPEELASHLLKYAKDWEMALQFLDTYLWMECGVQLDTSKIEQIIRHELREVQ